MQNMEPRKKTEKKRNKKILTIDLCREGAISAPDARYSRRDETCLCFVLFWITTVRGRN